MSQVLIFQSIQFDVVDRNGQPWIRANQIGLALGYKNPELSISKLFRSNADEFTDSMTAVVTLPTAGGPQETRIFSLRGCHLLAMFARTTIAKKFRVWVLDVLEELDRPQPLPLPPTTITPEQCRDLHNIVDAKLSSFPKDMQRKGYAEAWTRFNRHFRIAKYEQLPAHLFSEGQTYLINMQLHLALPLVSDNTAELEKLHDDILKKRSEMLIWANDINARFARLTGSLYQDVCRALPHKSRCVDTGVECLHTARYVGTDKLRDSLDYLSSAARYALYFNGRV